MVTNRKLLVLETRTDDETMITFLLLAITHTGHVIGTEKYLPHPLYAVVYVKTCHGEFENIYADKKLIISMANPFNTDADGHYRYYTNSYSGEVTIMYDGKSNIYRVCKEDEE